MEAIELKIYAAIYSICESIEKLRYRSIKKILGEMFVDDAREGMQKSKVDKARPEHLVERNSGTFMVDTIRGA
ncbi:hypothetical protein K1719_045785 [Acacia pycnantha]|nr:hypothetical protein K1719_045785 [Acacia pycnantha]